MASPRKYNIYLRPGKKENTLEWSYFNDSDDEYWNPVSKGSPSLLLKQKDEVDWIATGDIDDIDIILPNDPKVFDPVEDNRGKKPKSKAKKDMKAKALDKYSIKVTINGNTFEVDPGGQGADPPY